METVDAVGGRVAPDGATLASELIARAAAIGAGRPRSAAFALLPPNLSAGLRTCEERAQRLAGGWGDGWPQGAAVDFLGDAVVALASDCRFEAGEIRAAVTAAAGHLGLAPEAAAFAVFRRALASNEFVQLSPSAGAEFALALLVEFAPAAASSLWIVDAVGSTTALASHGDQPREGLEEVAQAALDGVLPESPHVRAQVVERWDRPYAALVVCGRDAGVAQLDAYLAETATALEPLLERASLFDRGVQREHDLVAASERRLVRLGFDLHDGPLQELVALAEEVRHAASQISPIVPDGYRQQVVGRFDDIYARLGALDESLRDIAHSIRSTTAIARPVVEAVEIEIRSLERATGMKVDFEVDGDLTDLSDSQKIVLFRVVQEALSNVRRHSGAARVEVSLRTTNTFVGVTVADNGFGFDPQQLGQHRLGLAGISERVRLLGGVVEIATSPGAGTTVVATLPQWRPSTPAAATVYAAAT